GVAEPQTGIGAGTAPRGGVKAARDQCVQFDAGRGCSETAAFDLPQLHFICPPIPCRQLPPPAPGAITQYPVQQMVNDVGRILTIARRTPGPAPARARISAAVQAVAACAAKAPCL